MRIEAKAALLPLLLGGLLSTAAAQRIVITDQAPPKTKAAPAKTPEQHASKPAAAPAQSKSSRKSSAQTAAHRPNPLADRLLSDDEGLKVIATALGAHIRHASGDDCSQLVHEIYERAGFSYPYANSWELYDGTSYFHRVWTPHPGDLVVWQGHVGIVVSPKEHLFFSKLTSSGQDTASYDAPYWRGRGHPHFFRYLKPEDGMEIAAAPRPRRKPLAKQVAVAQPARSPEPAGFDAAATDDPPPAAAAESHDGAPAKGHDGAAEETPAAESTADAATAGTMLVNSRKPQPEQVRQAIFKTLLKAAPALSGPHAPALSQPLIVFDDLKVEKVHLDGDQGWAEVRIHQVGAVRGGRAALDKRTHRAFWSLHRRDRESWEVVTPLEATYLPRDAAVPVVAHQLAVMTSRPGRADAASPQNKSLARLLNMLLEPSP